MPRVEWIRTEHAGDDAERDRPQAVVDAPDGARLLDLCDEARAPVSFSCRGATCGTCLVRVVQGIGFLDKPGDAEGALLAGLGLDGPHRLACQAEVLAGSGVVRLHCIGPDRREPEID